MKYCKRTIQSNFDTLRSSIGFTLVELLVALVVGTVVLGVTISIYIMQQRTFRRQNMIVSTQQNIRSAFMLMETELRMAGYDPDLTDSFGMTDITLDAGGNGTLTFTADNGSGGSADNGTVDPDETISYALYDAASTIGNRDLGRTVGAGPTELLAEGIEALGFAFAFDNDQDGRLDFNDDDNDGVMDTPPGGNEGLYWAVDSDGDNILDTNLDTNKDGLIDTADGTAALPENINADRIRAVRIFLLARTKAPDFGYTDNKTYVIGSRTVNPTASDSYRRRLLTATVKCRNLGL